MSRSAIATRGTLRVIARRAMVQRGLLPDFSSAVVAETDAIARAAVEVDPSIRDLRDLLWCSIDNDDSRDLDQLSVAEPAAGGAGRGCLGRSHGGALLGAGAPLHRPAPAQTTP